MPQISLYFGGVLILLGLLSYFGTGQTSLTAMIPSAFGVALAICGGLANAPSRRKLWMHVAATIALLGIIGVGMRAIPTLGSGAPMGIATWVQLITGVLLIVYVVLCVRSFIEARREPTAID